MQSLIMKTDLVRATMEGRKTETRRGQELKEINESPDYWSKVDTGFDEDGNLIAQFIGDTETGITQRFVKCPYKIGPAWIRETFFVNGDQYIYLADGTCCEQFEQCECSEVGKPKWKPSIHMPFAAARLFIHIDEIRLERIQDITEEGAIAEGVESDEWEWQALWRFQMDTLIEAYKKHWKTISARESFQSLITSINGPEMWDRNEWVWVLKYHRIEKP